MYRLCMIFIVCFAVMALLAPLVKAQENVVLVILDAWREDCLDAIRDGIPLMPFLSNFPATRFRNASSAASWTRPSMSSIFTGIHVNTHQAHNFSRPVPESAETIGEYMKSAGYATLAIQTNGVASADQGFGQGFDQFIFSAFAPADWVGDTALSLVEGTTGPFFLFLHYNQPHIPYFPPPAYRILMDYPPAGLIPYEQAVAEDIGPYQVDYLRYYLGLQPSLAYEPLSALGKDAIRSLYDGEVRFTDDELEVLFTSLLEDYPNTIIIVTADHGEHFWEHYSVGHATTVYEELIHVPLLIYVPGSPASSVDTLVSTVDLLPTIANLLGLPSRIQWEGMDMFGVRSPDGPVYTNAKYEPDWLINLEAIRWGNMKLIRNYTTGAVELYDLSSDPNEMVNLADSQPSSCQMMTTMLHQHLLDNARAHGPDSSIIPFPSKTERGTTVYLTAPDGIGHIWFRDGIPLMEDGEGITGVATKTLIISNVTYYDAGTYECMYNDAAFSLNVTTPYDLNVLPAESVSASSISFLFLLIGIIIAFSIFLVKQLPDLDTSRNIVR